MEAVCPKGDVRCEVYALAAALHGLQLYCASISAALICCCAPARTHCWRGKQWRAQNLRGVACTILFIVWVCGAASAALRPEFTIKMVSALMAPISWIPSIVLHILLWNRRAAAPLLYLAIYWLSTAVTSATILWQLFVTGASYQHVDVYVHGISVVMALLISVIDSICFYDEYSKRSKDSSHLTAGHPNSNISYQHNSTNFFSKISFFWMNSILYKGYKSHLEETDFDELPEDEQPKKFYCKFKRIYQAQKTNNKNRSIDVSILRCFVRMVWPNFYIAGLLKLLGDLSGLVPPLGLAVIVHFIDDASQKQRNPSAPVTFDEFRNNGYVMLVIVTVALVLQAFLSQNSTHLVTVEGTRLKIALQSMVYDKCMRLASWTNDHIGADENSSLLQRSLENTPDSQSGLLTNLISQDTYNIMSCVWICHYIWAIPLKVAAILYLLYMKLGISAVIGSAASILLVTPLQFYLGKKISDNSKDISKCTDNRISKIMEIFQGINVIKLYVWEDLFKEKILNHREVELKLLNRDSVYWSFLTFTTQVSTLLVTVITFTTYYYLESEQNLTAVNVFAGLALFNQLSVPLLILPVTVLMVIQAMVSTKRIKDFLELPESNNVYEEDEESNETYSAGTQDKTKTNDNDENLTKVDDDDGQFSDDDIAPLPKDHEEHIVRFRNASFSWGMKEDIFIEIDDLDIPKGKLIMVIGTMGSGKSSLLSAILGEMFLDRGEVYWSGKPSMWYAGLPPWLLEGSVRDNIIMDSPLCQRKYARVIRAVGLGPDLQILPEGDAARLGSHGAPLSGGQRVRVCVARALYSDATLLLLDEPLGALDAPLARHLVARALVPAARSGRTVILATTRLELLHYADMIIAMDNGRIAGVGCARGDGEINGVLSRWMHLAGEARVSAAKGGVGPPGGSARERSRLTRALSRARFQRCDSGESTVGISEVTGAHLLAEVPTCAGGSWRRARSHKSPRLTRQLSSPPPIGHKKLWCREIRRAVSADESNEALHREASQLRRLFRYQRTPHRTLSRWTPKTLQRLLSTDTDIQSDEIQGKSEEAIDDLAPPSTAGDADGSSNKTLDENIIKDKEEHVSDHIIWWEYGRACGWWGLMFWAAAGCAQALALGADMWLAHITSNSIMVFTEEQRWQNVRIYAAWCAACAVLAGAAQGASAAGGAAARRVLHERLLHAALHAPLYHHQVTPIGSALHRFSADVLVVDKKLPTAISRWVQLALLCAAAVLANVVTSPWTLLALIPALALYHYLQSIFLSIARELQHMESGSAACVVSLAAETCAGAGTVRAGRLQARMHAAFMRRVSRNHHTLLLLNSANRWLCLTLDLVGAGSVLVSVCVALCGGATAAAAGLAGAYSLLLPAYLAHLAKCRADLDQHLAAVERLRTDINIPHEDYREDCPIPPEWQRKGRIDFDNVTIHHEPGNPILHNISFSVSPGEKIAVCGRSGSGKSTLLLSCVGAAGIQNGRIFIDGHDITKVPLRALRHRIVVLPQDTTLFSGTLRENLDPLAVHTDEEIWRSLKAVGLHEFVAAQPAGLECIVCGARGRASCGWSGGRSARACAARAALHAPLASALLLDEPAATLDVTTDRALRALQTTVITVAHNVSSVRGYDRAVVLEEGRVVEQGTLGALLTQPTSRLGRLLASTERNTN